MTTSPFETLACPLDGTALYRNQRSWQCTEGHSFDMARQGYIHLLPVQNKRSRDPGDNKEMVAARQRFLNAGYYAPIAEALAEAVLSEKSTQTLNIMDAGCGEGYYLRYLAEQASGSCHLALLGLDISKWAVLAAAKQFKESAWVVGSNANLPVSPGTLDRILCLFGFPVYPEFHRVLRAGGQVIQMDAGPGHLKELREIIYPELKKPRPTPDFVPEGFEFLRQARICFGLTLPDQSAIADLLAMTPHLYRAGPEGLARAAALDALTVTVEVNLTCLGKCWQG